MTESKDLTVSFLEKRPIAAAQVLSQMNVEDAAAYLATIPTRIFSDVASKMNTNSLAEVMRKLPAEIAAATSQAMDYNAAAATLRLIPAEDRKPILSNLPQRLKKNLEASLSFPRDTVGSRMTTRILMMRATDTVSDAHQRLQKTKSILPDAVFVVGDDQRLIGLVMSVSLLRQGPTTCLSELMMTDIAQISARSRLLSIVDLPDWDEHSALPVVSRKDHLIGAISRSSVRAFTKSSYERVGANDQSLLMDMAETLFASVMGIGETLVVPTSNSSLEGHKPK